MIILCAVDPDDGSFQRVLKAAARLRRPADEIRVVHVFPRPIEWYREPGNPLEKRSEKARDKVRRVIELQLSDLEADVTVTLGGVGNTGDDIVEVADAHQADLIIIGTHGRTGLSALTLGSVAERVVRLAPCDVYVVKM